MSCGVSVRSSKRGEKSHEAWRRTGNAQVVSVGRTSWTRPDPAAVAACPAIFRDDRSGHRAGHRHAACAAGRPPDGCGGATRVPAPGAPDAAGTRRGGSGVAGRPRSTLTARLRNRVKNLEETTMDMPDDLDPLNIFERAQHAHDETLHRHDEMRAREEAQRSAHAAQMADMEAMIERQKASIR